MNKGFRKKLTPGQVNFQNSAIFKRYLLSIKHFSTAFENLYLVVHFDAIDINIIRSLCKLCKQVSFHKEPLLTAQHPKVS